MDGQVPEFLLDVQDWEVPAGIDGLGAAGRFKPIK
jgi:hypothetical protein